MNRKLSWSSWTFCTRQLSSLMAVAVKTAMTLKTYQNQAGLLVKDYLLSDPFVPYTSILGGILACKVVVPILCWNILEAWGNHSFVMMILVFFSFKCLIFSLFFFHEGLWSYSIDKCFLLQKLQQPYKDATDWMEQPVNIFPFLHFYSPSFLLAWMFFHVFFLILILQRSFYLSRDFHYKYVLVLCVLVGYFLKSTSSWRFYPPQFTFINFYIRSEYSSVTFINYEKWILFSTYTFKKLKLLLSDARILL